MILPVEPIGQVKDIFEAIKGTSKISEKESIIRENVNDKMFQFCLDF